MTNCRVCGKGLKNPKYVATGIGPVCARKGKGEANLENNKDMYNLYFDPILRDIVCQRTEDGCRFNIQHQMVKHSPTGMEWGYGGSGPADFAFNILLMFIPPAAANRLHQEFKWKFVATLPKEGGTIKGDDIRKWIENRYLGEVQ